MKILQIHKYYSKSRGGGSVTAFFETVELLRKMGHEVIIFSMKDEKNVPSPYEAYFINHFEIDQIKKSGFLKKIRYALKSIYNFEAQKKLQHLIDIEKPDIAHIHNVYHYLTPAILHTLKKNNIPMVFKLSDYKIICPNYKLFNKGKICEKCKKHKYYNCFLNKCLKNSRGISFIAMVEAYFHWILGSYKKVDYFLSPSFFMKNKCSEFGLPVKKIKMLRNVVESDELNSKGEFEENDYFIYYGRISEEKGIGDLIEATRKIFIQKMLFNNKLFIIGKGEEEKKLKKISNNLKMDKIIKFLGFKTGDELYNLIKKSKFVVLPSAWYDNSPLIISECQLLGKPVIVSDSGGSKEMIIKNKTGYIFKAGNVKDLSDKIKQMMSLSSEERRIMGVAGKENIKKINNSKDYYNSLVAIYRSLIQGKNR